MMSSSEASVTEVSVRVPLVSVQTLSTSPKLESINAIMAIKHIVLFKVNGQCPLPVALGVQSDRLPVQTLD